ncbi:MAG TPA: fatty acid hydroxylase [Planctomycetes bacterium]|nr:fatty acid hydroxylase [Planctomycetota bacterium]
MSALTLGAAMRGFVGRLSPFLLVLSAAGFLGARAWLGELSRWDAAVVLGVVAAYPFLEWVIHVFVLHSRYDFDLARKHREHHADPWRLDVVFIPWSTHAQVLPLVVAPLFLLEGTPLRLVISGLATLWLLGIVYEWVHYLAHVPYAAKTRWMRELQRTHRLHHFKNEHHWQGVATHLADRVLGTYPDPSSVETSPSCRSLNETPAA